MGGGVLCVGRNSVDFVFNVDLGRVGPDSKQRTGDPAVLIGGQCVNAAVTLAGLGCAVFYAGVVGDDVNGTHVMAFLAERGIDGIGVQHARGMANPCAYILVDKVTGERCIVETAPEAYPRFNGKISEAVWTAASYVYFDGHEEEASLSIAREAARRGIPTLTDAEIATDGTRSLLALVDTAIVPRATAAEIAGSDIHGDMLTALAELGGRRHVVTLGGDGAVGALKGDVPIFVPAQPCVVVDTTGAGDAFHAGFLFADMEGAPFGNAMIFAARVAAAVCATPGPSLDRGTLAALASSLNRETWLYE